MVYFDVIRWYWMSLNLTHMIWCILVKYKSILSHLMLYNVIWMSAYIIWCHLMSSDLTECYLTSSLCSGGGRGQGEQGRCGPACQVCWCHGHGGHGGHGGDMAMVVIVVMVVSWPWWSWWARWCGHVGVIVVMVVWSWCGHGTQGGHGRVVKVVILVMLGMVVWSWQLVYLPG